MDSSTVAKSYESLGRCRAAVMGILKRMFGKFMLIMLVSRRERMANAMAMADFENCITFRILSKDNI